MSGRRHVVDSVGTDPSPRRLPEAVRRLAWTVAMGAFFLLLWNPLRNHLYQNPILHAAAGLAGTDYHVQRYEANGYIVTPRMETLQRASGREAFTKRQSNTYYFLALLLTTLVLGAGWPDMARYWAVYLVMESLSVALLLLGLAAHWNLPLFLMEFNSFYLNRFIVVMWGFLQLYGLITGHALFPTQRR